MLGRTNTGGGGGGGLNFSVVGGTAAPNNPKENMIWVNTDAKITGYAFSATEPTALVDGLVWIQVNTNGSISFNALKKQDLQVYPAKCYQYISGVMTAKNAMIYQNGAWVEWRTYLFNKGDQCTDLTGGWAKTGYTSSNTTHSGSAGNMALSVYGSGSSFGVIGTAEAIDLTKYQTLKCNVTKAAASGCSLRIGSKKDLDSATVYKSIVLKETGEMSVDISSLEVSAYIYLWCTMNSATVDEVWLE